jgi:hypothetical protein
MLRFWRVAGCSRSVDASTVAWAPSREAVLASGARVLTSVTALLSAVTRLLSAVGRVINCVIEFQMAPTRAKRRSPRASHSIFIGSGSLFPRYRTTDPTTECPRADGNPAEVDARQESVDSMHRSPPLSLLGRLAPRKVRVSRRFNYVPPVVCPPAHSLPLAPSQRACQNHCCVLVVKIVRSARPLGS